MLDEHSTGSEMVFLCKYKLLDGALSLFYRVSLFRKEVKTCTKRKIVYLNNKLNLLKQNINTVWEQRQVKQIDICQIFVVNGANKCRTYRLSQLSTRLYPGEENAKGCSISQGSLFLALRGEACTSYFRRYWWDNITSSTSHSAIVIICVVNVFRP